MKKKINLIRIIITIIFGLLLYYLQLPAFNLKDPSFYSYILIVAMCYLITSSINIFDIPNVITNVKKVPKRMIYVSGTILSIFVVVMLINVICSPLFNSSSWASRIKVEEDALFTEDIKEVDFSKVPLIDKASSQKLGDRVMGQMSELVSQFYVSDLYTQINYNNEIVRVTPLEYNGLIKWFNNKKEGTKGYIKVNSVDGTSELVKLEDGMKYMPSAYFFKDLKRSLRIKYPTTIFGSESFEIDNDGNPYWVIPTVKYTGIGIKKEITGVILLDPITGKTTRYSVSDVPTWIDHVYSASLIIEQIDNWGLYKNGFFNSVFSQNGVVQTTDGYNYLVKDDDVYLYTGITSVSSDESNIGFVLTNLRTKETKFYQVPGAEEYSAMASAEGQVQQMKYTASFPLLINLNSRPTYLISLKDNAGLVKMYAFVDVTDYQKVVVTDSALGIEAAVANYLNNSNISIDTESNLTRQITISSITNVVIDGNTYYYIVDTNNQKYRSSIKINNNLLPFLTSGSVVEVSYLKEQYVIELLSLK